MSAELAVALLAVVVVLTGVVSVAQLSVAQISVQSGASAGARAAARGDPPADIASAAGRVAGPDALTRTAPGSGASVRVVVTRRIVLGLPGTPAVTVSGSASAALETVEEDGR